MSEKTNRKCNNLIIVFLTLIIISVSANKSSANQNSIYKFLPKNVLAYLQIKTNDQKWKILKQNKSLENIFSNKEINKDFFEIGLKSSNNLILSLNKLNLSKPDEFEFLIIMELKNDKIKKELLTNIVQDAKKNNFRTIGQKYKQAKILSVLPNNKAKKKEKAYYAFLDNFIVFTNGISTIQDAVKGFYSNKISIYNSSKFKQSFAKLKKGNQGQIYINMAGFSKKLQQFMEKSTKRSKFKELKNINELTKLTLDTQESVLTNFYLNSKSIELESYSLFNQKNKLAKVLAKQSKSSFKELFQFIPRKTIMFFAVADFFKTHNETQKLFNKKNKDIIQKSYQEMIGFNVEEIFKYLKDDISFFAFKTKNDPLVPGFAVVATTKNTNKTHNYLKNLKIPIKTKIKKTNGRKNQKLSIKSYFIFSKLLEYKGHKIITTNKIDDLESFQPSYTFINGKLIIASNVDAMEEIIDAKNNNLNYNKNFINAKKDLDLKNSNLYYISFSEIIDMFSYVFINNKNKQKQIKNWRRFGTIIANSNIDKKGIKSKVIFKIDLKNIDFGSLIPKSNRKKSLKSRQKRIKINPKLSYKLGK